MLRCRIVDLVAESVQSCPSAWQQLDEASPLAEAALQLVYDTTGGLGSEEPIKSMLSPSAQPEGKRCPAVYWGRAAFLLSYLSRGNSALVRAGKLSWEPAGTLMMTAVKVCPSTNILCIPQFAACA